MEEVGGDGHGQQVTNVEACAGYQMLMLMLSNVETVRLNDAGALALCKGRRQHTAVLLYNSKEEEGCQKGKSRKEGV